MNNFFAKLQRNDEGVSVIEFGLIAPLTMIMMLGTIDLGHSFFVKATLDGAIQNVARFSSLETAATPQTQAVVDHRLRDTVLIVAPTAEVTATRRFYKTFAAAEAAAPETIIEARGTANRQCDPGEKFRDSNRNGVWDADGGSNGSGGAKDIVLLKFKVSYPRLFPMANMMGWPKNIELESTTILANQPYGEQSDGGSSVEANCPAAAAAR
jgi:Flp pilus assembly pilin Flp